jgi:hypothetical protein
MKKIILLLLALSICFAIPVMAQEEKKAEGEQAQMAPPPPLNDEFINWMVGEWEGWTESPMGKSTDWQKNFLSLDGQFMLIDYKSEGAGGSYHGMGAITLSQSGEVLGYWIDNMRTMSEGKGTREGNVVTMEWQDQNGKMTRIMEKVSADKFTESVSWPGPDGTMMQAKCEMTRKPMMSDKK